MEGKEICVHTYLYVCIHVCLHACICFSFSTTVQKRVAVASVEQSSAITSMSDENQKLARLVDMGFSMEASLEALRSSGHDIEKACVVLTERTSEPPASSVKAKSKSGPSRWYI